METQKTISHQANYVMTTSRKDLYQVLQLPSFHEQKNGSPTITQQDIKKQYRQLVMLYHPDRNQHLGSQQTEQQFLSVRHAFEILGDAQKRRAYNQDLEKSHFDHHKSMVGEISEYVKLSEMQLREVNDKKVETFEWSCRCSSHYELLLDDRIVDNETGDISFDSMIVNCNGCSLKIKIFNDMMER